MPSQVLSKQEVIVVVIVIACSSSSHFPLSVVPSATKNKRESQEAHNGPHRTEVYYIVCKQNELPRSQPPTAANGGSNMSTAREDRRRTSAIRSRLRAYVVWMAWGTYTVQRSWVRFWRARVFDNLTS